MPKSKKVETKIDSVTKDAMFWYYYSLGQERTLEKVAEHFNVGLWEIKDISRNENWQDRIAKIEQSVDETNSLMLEYIDSLQFGVIEKIIRDENAKPTERLKALEYLNEFAKKHTDIVKKKKIVIEFRDKKGLEDVVNRIINRKQLSTLEEYQNATNGDLQNVAKVEGKTDQ